jgi:CrcB protein
MKQWMSAALAVGFGGFAGSLARYGLSLMGRRMALDWPVGTFAANLAGCLLIGALSEASVRGGYLSPATRLAVGTGFCGGFTTLSSLVYEAASMTRSGDAWHAGAYLGGTLLGASTAFVLGVLAVRILLNRGL